MKQKNYNTLEELCRLNQVNYRIDGQRTEIIELKDLNGLIIRITIPNGIFEWFVEVVDLEGNRLHSDWTEHYGDPPEILKNERLQDIEEFLNEILNGNLLFEGQSLLNKFYQNKK